VTAFPDLSAVRERCNAALALAERDALPHFRLDAGRLDDAADYVAAVTRKNYPDLAIPYHSRWRHFSAGGIDRWGALAASLLPDLIEIARIRIELCIVSVLLDAGAGPVWRYHDEETGQILARSEALAVASVHAFCAGLFSGDPRQKLRADAHGLSRLTDEALARAFQVSRDNPLPGLAGRAALLRRLGAALPGRAGDLVDRWRPAVAARDLLTTILELLAPVWPRPLGDVWHHPLLGMVPFHKLSQWLCYSLVEVLEQASIPVTGVDDLTGLAEYRNGGLFIDLGVLTLRDPALAKTPLPVDHPAVVEWRALTVALLDRLAPMVRERLGGSAVDLPLARLLQGGTWDAGRRIALERRADGSPPLVVLIDGTVF
jgi:hypothetical protein